MTPDELRALADALEPMAKAPRFEDFDVPAFCAWVRAQADAQPVAWIARNLTTGRVKWTTDRCRARGWTRDANLRVKLLYAHPAPAAPQAMEDANVWKQIVPDDEPQAEPKREPLSDDEILDIATAAGLRFSMYSDDVETRAAIKRLARAVERAHGISGGSDAE